MFRCAFSVWSDDFFFRQEMRNQGMEITEELVGLLS